LGLTPRSPPSLTPRRFAAASAFLVRSEITSSAFSSSTAYVYEAQTAPVTSSSSQLPPRTFATRCGQIDPDVHLEVRIETGKAAACATTRNYCLSFSTESGKSRHRTAAETRRVGRK